MHCATSSTARSDGWGYLSTRRSVPCALARNQNRYRLHPWRLSYGLARQGIEQDIKQHAGKIKEAIYRLLSDFSCSKACQPANNTALAGGLLSDCSCSKACQLPRRCAGRRPCDRFASFCKKIVPDMSSLTASPQSLLDPPRPPIKRDYFQY